ncbi:hypothetical protein CB0940_04092 [Cercospora beticola]|uniref:Prolyl 4-hydroxylase alpha subunit domain-containing protein n=1 Tax=Cercospora beticola TaxID=122368 RepID=A0A2G5HJ06_CERBT|nr:hypothetical protein CB0940_04092 [Cercospora beticola]PIA92546.1 hypothetical protein CB0940_04092 [Cercospora beticola]WPB01303.1 hypothetical protein RHO25_005927 [Cercospora beticola]
MASKKPSNDGVRTASSSNKWTTAAVLLPTLLFGIDKWSHISSKFSLDQWQLAQMVPSAIMPEVKTAMPNITAARTEMANRYAQGCPDHQYSTRLLSADPLVMYIEGLVTQEEADYLLVLAEPYYMASPLSGPMGRTYNNEYRKSVSAVVPDDPVVACIRKRAADFQGFMPVGHVEDIQLVKYGTSDEFRPHFDWHPGMLNPRVSTFFVYLACDDKENGGSCEGGETGFPRWSGLFATEWCNQGFVDCKQSKEGGIYFPPVIGNAVFWHNFYPNGTGVDGTYHAGMPVRKGRKVGLNIFSRKNEYFSEILEIHDRNQLSEADRKRCDAESKDGPCYVEVL